MAGLLDFNPDENPADLSLLAMNADQVAPGLTSDAPPAPPASMADEGPGFWSRLGRGFTDVTAGVGEALGAGLDASITGHDRTNAGIRALMSASVNMLANSGPSYTPRNFGQIAAASLAAAGETNQLAELNQFRRDQSKQTIALRQQQLQQQGLMSKLALLKYGEDREAAARLNKLIEKLTGGGDGAPAAEPGATAPTGAGPITPEVQADFVNKGWPLWTDIAQKTGFTPEVVAGIAAHETGWGTSPAAQKGNLFGISSNEKPLTYASPMEGATAFVTMMNSPAFKGVDRSGTPAEVIGRLAKAGYNTADPQYTDKAARLVGQISRLRSPDQPAPVQAAGPAAPTGVAPPAAPADGAAAAPPMPPVAPATTPPAPAAAPAAAPPPPLPKPSDTEVPPPDLSRIAKERAEAAKAHKLDLAAAAAIPASQVQAKAAAVAAAVDKKRTQDAALADAEAKERADYQKRLGEWQTKERQRYEDLTNKRAEKQAEHEQALAVQAAQAKAAQDLEILKLGGKRQDDRLKESAPAAQAAKSLNADIDQLELAAPAIMAGGPDPIADKVPAVRDWLRTIGAGTNADTDKWRAQDVWQAVTAKMRIFTQQDFKGAVSDQEGALIRQAFHSLSQDPQNIPFVLGMQRAMANRMIQYHQLRDDFAGAHPGQTEGMDRWVNQQLGQKGDSAIPPPLFEPPPDLLAPKVGAKLRTGEATEADYAAAKSLDAERYKAYEEKDRPSGVPYIVWGRQADTKSDNIYRVPALRVKMPDGRIYTQQFPPRG